LPMTESVPPSGEEVSLIDTCWLVYQLAYLVNEILEFPYRDRTPEAVTACTEHFQKLSNIFEALLQPPHNQEELLKTDPALWAIKTAHSLLKRFPVPKDLQVYLARLPDGVGFAIKEPNSAGGALNLSAATRRPVLQLLGPRRNVLEELESVFLLLYPMRTAQSRQISPEGCIEEEEWLPANKAVEVMHQIGYSIDLPQLSKLGKKKKVRMRPRQLQGNHQQEVEVRSLILHLAKEKRKKPLDDDIEGIEQRKREVAQQKKRERSQ
jgi:hypothetical protein